MTWVSPIDNIPVHFVSKCLVLSLQDSMSVRTVRCHRVCRSRDTHSVRKTYKILTRKRRDSYFDRNLVWNPSLEMLKKRWRNEIGLTLEWKRFSTKTVTWKIEVHASFQTLSWRLLEIRPKWGLTGNIISIELMTSKQETDNHSHCFSCCVCGLFLSCFLKRSDWISTLISSMMFLHFLFTTTDTTVYSISNSFVSDSESMADLSSEKFSTQSLTCCPTSSLRRHRCLRLRITLHSNTLDRIEFCERLLSREVLLLSETASSSATPISHIRKDCVSWSLMALNQARIQESLYAKNGIHTNGSPNHYGQQPPTYQSSQQVYQTNGSIIVNPISQPQPLSTSTGVPTAIILGSNHANGSTTTALDSRNGNRVIPVSGTCQDFVSIPESGFGKKTRRDYIIIFLIFLGVVVMVVTAGASLVYLVKCE